MASLVNSVHCAEILHCFELVVRRTISSSLGRQQRLCSKEVNQRILAQQHLSNFEHLESLGSVRYYCAKPKLLEIRKRVLEVVAAYDVTADKLILEPYFINDLGLDSLDHVVVIMAMEDEFGLEIPDGDADHKRENYHRDFRFPQNKFRSLVKVTSLGAVASAISLYKGNEKFFESVLMPIVRMIPPETTHRLAVFGVKMEIVRPNFQDPGTLRTRLLAMAISNPVGIAAGFDKHGEETVNGLHQLGFGFVEIGSVTPNPQPGNPRPRVFRLNEDKAIVNRLVLAEVELIFF